MKKFLILTLLFTSLALPVFAEQPAAERYRQMFTSGNFYVEYEVADKSGYWGNPSALRTNIFGIPKKNLRHEIRAAQDGQRIAKTGSIKDKYPSALYRNGKYYKFTKVEEETSNIIGGAHKKILRNAYVLDEDKLYSSILDPDEHWETVRKDLTLPDAFRVLFPNDPMNDDAQISPNPIFNGESKRIIDDKEYDCDQYVSDIKSLAGTTVAQQSYNILYDSGKLVRVQKYLIRDGKEFLVSDLVIHAISSEVPGDAFTIHKKFKLYAARNGDINDLLDNLEQIGEMGGTAQ